MRSTAVYLCCFLMLCSWMACTPGQREQVVHQPVVEHIKPKYAKGFDWKMLADSSYQITLFNLESLSDTLQVIHWKPRNIQRIACLSTTHIPFIASLEKMNLLKGCGFADRSMDSTAKAMVAQGELANLTTGNELEPEVVFSIQPELLFVYPFGGKSYEKFLSNGIGCIQVSEYLEKHPLGRAEWIRLFGCILGAPELADSIFLSIERDYIQLRNQYAQETTAKPKVFVGSMDGDRWAVPSANSYLATLIRDAGGTYLFNDTASTGNIVLPFESFYTSAATADWWGKIIYEPDATSAEIITQGDDRLRNLPAFSNHKVFSCNALQADYHGQAILEPAILLRDLHSIFSELPPSENPKYFMPWVFYE